MNDVFYIVIIAVLILLCICMAAAFANRKRKLSKQIEILEKEKDRLRGIADEKEKECAALSVDSICPKIKEGRTEQVDIIKIAEQVVEELHTDAQKNKIAIDISTQLKSLNVYADSNQLKIMFKNIVDNSIKYMQRSGVLIITISTIADDIFIVLKDNGNGLSKEETPHIFELNYQGSNRVSGNGLGLTQAKAIVEAYGGEIYAKSSIGEGMGIYIQIPMRDKNK